MPAIRPATRAPEKASHSALTFPRDALERVVDFAAVRMDKSPAVLAELDRLPRASRREDISLYGPFAGPVAALTVAESTDKDKSPLLRIMPWDDLFRAHCVWTELTRSDSEKFWVRGWPHSPSQTGRCQGCGQSSESFFCDDYCESVARWWGNLPPAGDLGELYQPTGPSLADTQRPPVLPEVAAAEKRTAVAVAAMAVAEGEVAALRAELRAVRAELDDLKVADARRRMGRGQ